MGQDKQARGKRPKRGDGDSFVALYAPVISSAGWRQVSHTARSLLVDIAAQYRGRNNGQLVAAQKYLKPLGWNSANVVTWALRELCAARLLVETRKGGINRPSWFAVTWHPLDWAEGMDCDAWAFERAHRFAYRISPDPPPKRPPHRASAAGASSTPPGGVEEAAIAPPGGVEQAPLAPPGGAIRPC